MSDPLTDKCVYCGSLAVLDDAWFCGSRRCYAKYQREQKAAYEQQREWQEQAEQAGANDV